MSDLLVIVPSRGRPDNAHELLFAATKTHSRCEIRFAVDNDDPTINGYPLLHCEIGSRTGSGMTGALNRVADNAAQLGAHRHIGFMGDDHRPRTPQWDEQINAALDELGTGIVYGNDLIHGETLPTAVFMTADIIRALGYMAPPRQYHLYLDNAWLELGRGLDAIRYLPDVIIEHMHPLAGKAPSDAGYERVNAPALAEHDRVEFERWRAEELPVAVEKICAGSSVR